jgi:hypothetical protein
MNEAQIFDQMCDLAETGLDADGLYHAGFSLALLGLSKMEVEARDAQLGVLETGLRGGLEGLDALRQRKKLNGHAKSGGLAK